MGGENLSNADSVEQRKIGKMEQRMATSSMDVGVLVGLASLSKWEAVTARSPRNNRGRRSLSNNFCQLYLVAYVNLEIWYSSLTL